MRTFTKFLMIMALAHAAAGSIPVPELPPGQKPNFIIIVTDDQGWDDIGINNPKYVNTPNLDKFIKGGMLFDNYYTAPQCAQTRAQLLTGRAFARTGTMLTHGCYDFIHSDEATMGAVMQQAGYYTAQFGKWHNLDVLGVNGIYTFNHRRYIEEALSDRILYFAKKQARQLKQHPDSPPFLLFYSPHAIHVTYQKYSNGTVGDRLRFFPPEYKEKYHDNPYYKDVPVSTLDAWAMLEYLDLLLGLLWDFVAASPELRASTYILVTSDNGSSLMEDEQAAKDKYRMPSKVRGNKSTVFEGGIRGWLAVQGPGIPAGVVDSTLVDATDILPTIVDLAGFEPGTLQHLPWDGLSFKNLLLAPESRHGSKAQGAIIPAPEGGNSTATGSFATGAAAAGGNEDDDMNTPYRGVVRRGTAFATSEQWERHLVVLGPQCWDGDLVLALNGDREVLRPQPLLRWKDGGMVNSVSGNKGVYAHQPAHPGFKMCVAVRHKQYKWSGLNNKVYRLDSRHLEEQAAVVTGEQGRRLARKFAAVARSWWDQMTAERHSFEKPVFYLGLGNWTVTNMVTCGAYQRTRKTVKLQPIGASGFQNPGDEMCFNLKILQSGVYDVTVFYVASHWSTFKLAVGTHAAVLVGSAPSVVAQLPPSTTLAGRQMGALDIPAFVDRKVEACLVLVENGVPGRPVMKNIANVRLTRRLPDLTNTSLHDVNSSDGSNGTEPFNQTDTTLFGSSNGSFNQGSGSLSDTTFSGENPTGDTLPSSDAQSSDTPTSDTSAGDTSPTGDTLLGGMPNGDTPTSDTSPWETQTSDTTAITDAPGGSTVSVVPSPGNTPFAGSQGSTELRGEKFSGDTTHIGAKGSSFHQQQLARPITATRNQLNALGGSRQHRRSAQPTTVTAAGGDSSSTGFSSTVMGSTTAPVAVAAEGLDVLGQYTWLLPQSTTSVSSSSDDRSSSSSSSVALSSSSSSGDQASAWEDARWRHGWPDGLDVFESMFAPYEWEDTSGCEACRVPL